MSNELAITDPTGELITPWSELALPSTANSLIDSEVSVFELAIRRESDLVAIGQWVPQAEKALAPCPPEEINRMLGKMATAVPMRRTSEAEALQKISVYMDALSDIPRDILSSAMMECVKSCMFFPTIKEIRHHALPELNSRKWRLSRAKAILAHGRNKPPEPVISDEERAKVSEGLAKLIKDLECGKSNRE